jgi:hypothetical protein
VVKLDNSIVSAFATENTPYELILSTQLLPSLDKIGLKYHIEIIENKGSWLKNVAQKPLTILHTMEKYPSYNIVSLDADSEVLQFPKLFNEISDEYDLALHTLDWDSWYKNGSHIKETLSGCYDEETMILSENGWKYFKDLTYKDRLLGLNPNTNYASYYEIKTLVSKDYEGKMFYNKTQQGDQMDFCVTPNHNMYVYNTYKKKWIFTRADKIFPTKNHYYKVNTKFLWEGENIENYILKGEKYKPGGRGGIFVPYEYKINMKHWLTFLGWYLSEGCCSSNIKRSIREKKKPQYGITITQSLLIIMKL